MSLCDKQFVILSNRARQLSHQCKLSMSAELVPNPNPQSVRSVRDLLALHGSWNQTITVAMPGRGGVSMSLFPNCVWPVSLCEYEVVACVSNATEESGLKWWLRRFRRSTGAQFDSTYNWGSLTFVCPHYREDYVKQAKDNSRDSKHRSCVGCKCILSIKGTVVCCSLFSKCHHVYR